MSICFVEVDQCGYGVGASVEFEYGAEVISASCGCRSEQIALGIKQEPCQRLRSVRALKRRQRCELPRTSDNSEDRAFAAGPAELSHPEQIAVFVADEISDRFKAPAGAIEIGECYERVSVGSDFINCPGADGPTCRGKRWTSPGGRDAQVSLGLGNQRS